MLRPITERTNSLYIYIYTYTYIRLSEGVLPSQKNQIFVDREGNWY